MKKLLKKIGLGLKRILVTAYMFLKTWVSSLPKRIKAAILRFAIWGEKFLDKRINKLPKKHIHDIIFKSETKEGRLFDTVIIWLIVFSIIVVMLETVAEFHATHWWIFFVLEWIFTITFTAEYILRLYSAHNTLRYATSFFGIVDLLAIVPAYFGVFFTGAQNLLIVRALRLLRVFRIFKMGHFVKEGQVIMSALQASKTKIYIFMTFVVLMSMIIGSIMYIVEGEINSAMDNIPKAIYWAIVTLTTVGYGDVTPITPFGKFLATIVMIMGYGVIAVPTGIVTAEISGRVMNLKEVFFLECVECGQAEHHFGGLYCHKCGTELEIS